MKLRLSMLIIAVVLLFGIAHVAAYEAKTGDEIWYNIDTEGSVNIQLYFFWSKKCPHCLSALPYMKNLAHTHPWLTLHSLELNDHPENVTHYVDMASRLGKKAESIPAFFFCNSMVVGYDDSHQTGEYLRQALSACQQHLQVAKPLETFDINNITETPISLPILGNVEPSALSLPVMTIVLAGLDAFNPCAFFVLLFLLSLMVNAKSRTHMLLVGGIFVFFSGLMYFLFMAAWLNVFLIMGELRLITLFAGILATAIALINIKDYFWFKTGISLSIPETARPGLFLRMRQLISARGLYPVLVGTIGLALFANAYEFLCTAGFPMVFTRILTLQQLPIAHYYLYLVLYNIIYVIPLTLIVLIFCFTLGSRKLQEEEGRILKLVSGLMMLELGVALVIAPEMLNKLSTSILLLIIAIVSALIIIVIGKLQKTAG